MSGARAVDAEVRDAYDRVPYPSGSIHSSHPDNLATRALLLGLEPPDLQRVRVLELGCSDGGNLIPMASELPAGRFLGIDLSPRQITDGQRRLEALGIANVELREMSLLDAGGSLGEFDYVIAHGVYSWVGPEVQEALLRICRECLAPAGVAYVSYNALPGWHQRLIAREMMTYHTRGIADPYERADRALGVLDLVAGAAAGDVYSSLLRERLAQLSEHRDRPSYVIHEYLEESNEPVWFHQFMARAGRHGLQYLADADTPLAEIEMLPAEVQARLRALAPGRLELEQALDFVVDRTFRRSLLCRQGPPVELAMVPERIERLHAASSLKPESPAPDVRSTAGEPFRGERDRAITVSHPPVKALLVALAGPWPRALPFADLRGRVQDLLGGTVEEGLLADMLFSLYCGGLLDLHLLPPRCTETVSERPRTSELARREAALSPYVTNARRRILKLDDDFARVLLQHLDGTRDRAALREVLAGEVAAGRLAITRDGEPLLDPEQRSPFLDALLEQTLRKMAGLALLAA
ncbi:MAG TPA: class I SAM-dependent methyltransferase [Thermoanaerobaculia bacterium]